MASKWKVSLVLLLVLIAAIACQREGRDIANVPALSDAPQYEAAPNIHSVPAQVHIASVAPVAMDAGPNGEKLYNAHCTACHQTTGMGVPTVFPPLVGSGYVVGDNIERLAAIMLYGLIGPITVNGVEYNSVMTPFSHLSDEELAAIASYIRSSWGNSAGPVEADVFAAQRARWGQRGQFRIEELGAEE